MDELTEAKLSQKDKNNKLIELKNSMDKTVHHDFNVTTMDITSDFSILNSISDSISAANNKAKKPE